VTYGGNAVTTQTCQGNGKNCNNVTTYYPNQVNWGTPVTAPPVGLNLTVQGFNYCWERNSIPRVHKSIVRFQVPRWIGDDHLFGYQRPGYWRLVYVHHGNPVLQLPGGLRTSGSVLQTRQCRQETSR
jgi:hypothetical protein